MHSTSVLCCGSSCVYWQLTLAKYRIWNNWKTAVLQSLSSNRALRSCSEGQPYPLLKERVQLSAMFLAPPLLAMSLCVKVPGAWGSPGSDRLHSSPHLHPVLQGNSRAPRRCWPETCTAPLKPLPPRICVPDSEPHGDSP